MARARKSPRATHALHGLLVRGDVDGVGELLGSLQPKELRGLLDAGPDGLGPPLVFAARHSRCGVDLLELLVQRYADADRLTEPTLTKALAAALSAGFLAKARSLVAAGADLHYRDVDEWDEPDDDSLDSDDSVDSDDEAHQPPVSALVDALRGPGALRDPGLGELVDWLLEHDVPLDPTDDDGRTALQLASDIGRWDVLRRLRRAGADHHELGFTPLHFSVVFDAPPRLAATLARRPQDLEETDHAGRTPLLLAAQRGDVVTIDALLTAGADPQARGADDRSILSYPIRMGHTEALRFLLWTVGDIEEAAALGTGELPLFEAARCDNAAAVEVLLEAGARAELDHWIALDEASGAASARALLKARPAGAQVSPEAQRVLVGLTPEADAAALDCSPEDFEAARVRSFPSRNGADITHPYYLAMIRSGVAAWNAVNILARDPGALERLGSDAIPPVWCAARLGQTITLLEDGRAVQIGGSHEDWYDPDFCIYNDVFVHDPDGGIRVRGYPPTVFPPTVGHSATLVDAQGDAGIIVIGGLGYPDEPAPEVTPVYRLRVGDWRIEPLVTAGHDPGTIHEHTARQISPDEIEVFGGRVSTKSGSRRHTGRFVLDVPARRWRRLG